MGDDESARGCICDSAHVHDCERDCVRKRRMGESERTGEYFERFTEKTGGARKLYGEGR